MYRRNNKIVLRYDKPIKNLFPEECAHHMLILCYRIFNESDLKLTNSFLLKINNPDVLNIVNRNREVFEPASDIHICFAKILVKQKANCCLLLQVKLLIQSL